MIASSFRHKIVLWSVLISSLVLLSFSWVVWWSLHNERIAALDESLSTFGIRHATRATAKADPQRMEVSMVENFGEQKVRTRFFAFLTKDNRELYRSTKWPAQVDPGEFAASKQLMNPQPRVPAPPERDSGKAGRRDRPVMMPAYFQITKDRQNYRIGVFANEQVKLVVGANLSELNREAKSLRRAFLIALPGAVLLIALGAWQLSKRALRPVTSLRRDMQQISAQALNSRLEVEGAATEFAGIIDQYNAMLERLERSFHQATRFSADASHELKTPLAIMRATLERALSECEDDPARQAAFSELLEQTDRQKAVLDNLLLLSRADAGQLKISAETIDLSAALNIWLEDAGYLAEARDIKISSQVSPDLSVQADKTLLQQVAHNLFSNAVRHNVDQGYIECTLQAEETGVVWQISNTGPLIDEDKTQKIFDRFYRGDNSNGTGLGLSLVKEIITAHGGSISGSATGDRNVIRVLLPKITPS